MCDFVPDSYVRELVLGSYVRYVRFYVCELFASYV
jgi:hypothetical protein